MAGSGTSEEKPARVPARMRLAALLGVLLLASCAAPSPITGLWAPPSNEAWDRPSVAGINLRRQDGSLIAVPALKLAVLVKVHRDITARNGMNDVILSLAESDSPNAFATTHQGRRLVAISISFLDLFWNDPDALATTIGHEMGHLQLQHQAARKDRRDTALAASNVIGTILGLAGVPMGGTIAGLGADAIVASYSRDDERAADRVGIAWAADAGYDPCGHARVIARLKSLSSSASLPFLASHPGYEERSEVADQLSRQRRGVACGGQPEKTAR